MIHDVFELIRELWRDQPVVLALSVFALFALLFVVIDTHFCQKRRRKRRSHRSDH